MWPWFFGALLACSGGADTGTGTTDVDGGSADGGSADGDTDGGSDGGSDGDTDGGADCTATVVDTIPAADDDDVYWRDPLSVTVDQSDHDATFELLDADGGRVGLDVRWDEDGVIASLQPTAPLRASTAYQLTTRLCGADHVLAFSTSDAGAALTIPAASLVGRTYHFDTPAADFVQPEGLGSALSAFLTAPLLIGVTQADDTTLDLLGAMGWTVNSRIEQDLDQTSWDLPPGTFQDAPYFFARADSVVFTYVFGGDEVVVPIDAFEVEGTFASDGSAIIEGRARGMADTRNLGVLLDLGESPTAICELFSGGGLSCEACDDGIESCVFMEAQFPDAPLMPGLELVVVE